MKVLKPVRWSALLILTYASTAASPAGFQTLDLAVGEPQSITLSGGRIVTVKLLSARARRDSLRKAVREARVVLELNGKRVELNCGNYHLPTAVDSVQIDCPFMAAYREDFLGDYNPWALEKDARLRIWAKDETWGGGKFRYPLRQRWFAGSTQLGNEPVYVDGNDRPLLPYIYYHNDTDLGAAEGLVEVLAATGGVVVAKGRRVAPDLPKDAPVSAQYDVIYILDADGWYHRYSHLHSLEQAIAAGQPVRAGDRLGLVGKEGGAGGWSHLHYEILRRQANAKWGTEAAHAFLWEAYRNEYDPPLMAVARPHHLVAAGQTVELDGSRSWSRSGMIREFAWKFTDGTEASGARMTRSYPRPGSYSEILRVTDQLGNVAYDFAIVQALAPQTSTQKPQQLPPTIHAAYHPTFGIKAGDEVVFKVRTFRTTHGSETWDFGDGTPPVTVRSDGNVSPRAKDGYAVTHHTYRRPGAYLVRVERANERGEKAIGHLSVEVGPN